MIYLDHCATTPLDPRVKAAMDDAAAQNERCAAANASSVHAPGRAARAILNRARREIAELIHSTPEEIVFTGSASESNNLAIKGLAFAAKKRPFRIAVSAIEHDCVIESARWLARRFDWIELREIPCASDGVVHPDAIEQVCRTGVDLVSLMTVNHETGARQPVEAAAEIAHRCDALFHTDAVQAAGRVEVNAAKIGCDLLTLSAHKINGPQGVGLLNARKGLALDSLVHGGHQERGLRAGTENWIGAVGFAAALRIAVEAMQSETARLREMESEFLARLQSSGMEFSLNGGNLLAGDGGLRAPGILNLSLRGAKSHDLVAGMDIAGFAISAGAACSSGVIEPSRVLSAMGIESWRIESAIRISFGRTNKLEDVIAAADALANLNRRLSAEGASRT